MSYDIWATVQPAPNRFTTHLEIGNMTSNVAPMWRAACPKLDGLADIDGRHGFEVSPALLNGLSNMFTNRRELERLNPASGWGNFTGAFRYFAYVTKTARDHPDAVFWVSR